jgi:hypothetical protein
VAIVSRGYSETPEWLASYDYDDQLMKLVAIHVDTDVEISLEIRNGADDLLVAARTFVPGTTDLTLTGTEQVDVTVNEFGKVSNVYMRTVE